MRSYGVISSHFKTVARILNACTYKQHRLPLLIASFDCLLSLVLTFNRSNMRDKANFSALGHVIIPTRDDECDMNLAVKSGLLEV